MKNKTHAILASLFLAAAACASSSAQDTNPGASAGPATPDVTGTWRFVLDQSDVAAPLRESCASDDACLKRLSEQAAREKIRFDRDARGNLVWSSFETDGKSENLFLQAPVELVANGPGHVVVKVVGSPSGIHAERLAKAGVKLPAVDLEIVDAKTIAMTDPKKGRLVYTKE